METQTAISQATKLTNKNLAQLYMAKSAISSSYRSNSISNYQAILIHVSLKGLKIFLIVAISLITVQKVFMR